MQPAEYLWAVHCTVLQWQLLQVLCLKMIDSCIIWLSCMSNLFCGTWCLKSTNLTYLITVKSNSSYWEFCNVQKQPTKHKAKYFKAGHTLACSAVPAGSWLHLSLLVLSLQHNIRNGIPLDAPWLHMTTVVFF